MRRHGAVDGAGGFGLHDHVCWPFDDRAEFVTSAAVFLADGLRLRQRLVYVGDGPAEQLRSELGALGSVDELEQSGVLVVCPLEGFCDPSVGVVPARQLAFCDELVARALSDGFTGLRFAAEVTSLAAGDTRSWRNHTRWEQLADTYMDVHPMAALCGYQRGVVGDLALRALTTVHPLRAGNATPFGLFVLNGEVCLEGELDGLQADLAHALLASLPVDGHEVVVDVSGLQFADGAGTGELAWFARQLGDDGRRVVLRSASPMLVRVWDLLGFSSFAPVEFAA